MSTERIERRIAGRLAAVEVAGCLGSDTACPHFMAALIEKLQADCLPSAPVMDAPKPPSIAMLGDCRITFGAHAGKSLDEIPIDYLDWLCREQEEFYRTLRAYLTHPDLESRRRGVDP